MSNISDGDGDGDGGCGSSSCNSAGRFSERLAHCGHQDEEEEAKCSLVDGTNTATTRETPISGQPRRVGLAGAPTSANKQRLTMNKTRRSGALKMLLSSLAALSLLAAGANASLFSFAFSSSGGAKSEQQQPQTAAAQATANHQDLNSSQAQSVGDLVAIGAVSLLDSPPSAAASSPSGASLTTELAAGNGDAANEKDKLDYMIDFMRANKLGKFCDLITSQEAPVRQLHKHLNGLQQFTLFVPTNEALLLMPSGQLEQIRRQPELLAQFLAAHATDELVVPREPTLRSPPTLASLSGGQLRVVTVAPPPPANTSASALATGSTRLELIVNGANVLSGNSYALQEPNNQKVTYAIVHLIDRVLYPMPEGRLADKVRALAPRMARYFELANNQQLTDSLEARQADGGALWTLFLPNDDAFQATPVKLLDQLDSNRTFLLEFLRGHLIEGLYFSNQLAMVASSAGGRKPAPAPFLKLASLSGKLLEIESKMVQSRTLVLINSTPLVEPADIMALNGVLHMVSRPILERHLADDCNCAVSAAQPAEAASRLGVWPPPQARQQPESPSVVTYEFDNRAASNWARKPPGRQQADSASSSSSSSSSSIQYAPGAERGTALTELEREESRPVGEQQVAGERVRSQRSGALLVERNNRDFYRPSTAPANLQAAIDSERPSGRLSAGGGAALQEAGSGLILSSGRKQQQQEPFDVVETKYKVVLNATTRQRLREMQRGQSDGDPTSSRQSFAYDRPMVGSSSTAPPAVGTDSQQQTTPSSSGFLLRRPYTPTPRTTSLGAEAILEANKQTGSSATNHQPADQLGASPSSISRLQQQQQPMIKFQPEDARDPAAGTRLSSSTNSFARNTLQQPDAQGGRELASKTVAPFSKNGGTNCAFYDTDCRRMLGKLVRLPPIRNRPTESKSTSSQLMHASGSNHTIVRTSPPSVRLSAQEASNIGAINQHLDSTFGETESNNGSQSFFGRVAQQQNRPVVGLSHQQPAITWSGDQADIARIKQTPAHGFTSGISRAPPSLDPPLNSAGKAPAEILLLPVKVVQIETVSNLTSSSQQSSAGSSFIERPQLQASGKFAANNNRHFHAPTPYPVNLMTTHMPPIFGQQHKNNNLGRLTNFTAFEYSPSSPDDSLPPARAQTSSNSDKQIRFESGADRSAGSRAQAALKSPAAVRKQQQRIQQQLSADEQFGPTIGGGSDMSITSAKLTSNNRNHSHQAAAAGLLLQASNVGTNFVRSAVLPPASSAASGGSDFFQDRSIAEIMEDSGLRIDGQQVTFSRLKECLEEAKLLNLVTQNDQSLTIFMPTDMAFQRLVQQQALLHQARQREARTAGSSRVGPTSGGVQLLPLMARANPRQSAALSSGSSASSTSASAAAAAPDQPLDAQDSASQAGFMTSVGDRLTLDCGSQQVRKLLLDHLSNRLIQPKQLTADMGIGNLNGHQLLLSSVPSKKIVVVDGQPVIAATRAKNGMVYVVNKFLNLTQQMPNVMELMESQPNLTTFLSYLSFSSMSDRLKRETGPLTILAPTNEAFEQLTPAARQLINSDPAALADILRGHIIEGAQFGKLIPMRNQLKTMNTDQSIEAKVIKPNVYLLDNQMTTMRLLGTTGNGVVNAIDRLIVPAWLKVSMGSAKPALSSSLESLREPTSLPGARLRPAPASAANLNLPTITNQPLRFEQPTNTRFASSNGRDSFLLDSTIAPGPISGNTLLSDLDGPSSSSADSLRNPFAAPPSGDPSDSTRVQSVPAQANSTSTKNMQLIEKLAQLMQARKFVRYLSRSGVSDKLKPDMNYVILVPTDQAIEKLPKQIIDLLDRDRDRLADLINYHVLDTTFEYINTIPDGQTLQTLNEKDILFNWHRNNTILTASGAVVMGGIQEENIALLIVDRVLYPTPGDILNIISKSPILSNFTSLVRNAGLEKQLSLAGPFTLFAPSDFAFNQLTRADMDLLRRNKETARRFLLRHLSQPAIFTSSIALSNSSTIRTQHQNPVPQMTLANSLGEELTLRQRSDYFSVNEVNFSYADVAATNGVVHVIDGLL